MSNEPTYDLTVPGLTESALRLIASRGDNGYVGTAARVRLAEIDAERANTEAVEAAETVERRVWRAIRNDATKIIYDHIVLASDLRSGDVVEGRTVAWLIQSPQDRGVLVRFDSSETSCFYAPGSLVLLDSEVAT